MNLALDADYDLAMRRGSVKTFHQKRIEEKPDFANMTRETESDLNLNS